jgi:asparagine synthase (glutamine-hydrolysing)
MCGIAGSLSLTTGVPVALAALRSAAQAMVSRGPDGGGEWIGNSGDVALAHRRLAIIDLSDSAAQPMPDAQGRYVISFNGEIYNYLELRAELLARGAQLRTSSDTEVILELFARDGVAMLPRLRGMFAFAIWDCEQHEMVLARDIYGIKPLYVATVGNEFRFASQVKALLTDPALPRAPDPVGYAGYRLWGSVPEPHTMFAAVRALPAGHSLKIRQGHPVPDSVAFGSVAESFADRRESLPDTADALLDTVRHHLVADVEVGCFLSGGVDSGAMVALMRDAGQQHIRTITLAFDEFAGTEADETHRAIKLAAHYGVDHTVARITRTDFERSMPLILAAMDQPSIDGVNSWFVSRATAEQGLKVALSGLGGDELLAGYSTFHTVPSMLARRELVDSIPLLGGALRQLWRSFAAIAFADTPKARYALDYSDSLERAYLLRRSLTAPPALRQANGSPLLAQGLEEIADGQMLRAMLDPRPGGSNRQIAVLESAQYMRNQLLRDTDWASMAHSLEVRVPLVDIPLTKAIAGRLGGFGPNEGKRVLAGAPSRPLPTAIVEHEKTGFAIPVASWLKRGAEPDNKRLDGWAERVLDTYVQDTGLDLPR